jgi:hypothetical protein
VNNTTFSDIVRLGRLSDGLRLDSFSVIADTLRRAESLSSIWFSWLSGLPNVELNTRAGDAEKAGNFNRVTSLTYRAKQKNLLCERHAAWGCALDSVLKAEEATLWTICVVQQVKLC